MKSVTNNFVILPPPINGEALTHTHGHYHPGSQVEVHEVLEGEAIYILQEVRGSELGPRVWVRLGNGEKLVIPPDTFHLTLNPSTQKDLMIANWIRGEDKAIYPPEVQKRFLLSEVESAAFQNPAKAFEQLLLNRIGKVTPEEFSNYRLLLERFDLPEVNQLLSRIPTPQAGLTRPPVVVLDIGGTHFRISILDREERLIVPPRRYRTPSFETHPGVPVSQLQQMLVEQIVERVRELQREYPAIALKHVGLSFAGPVSSDGKVLRAPTIWGAEGKNYPLLQELRKKISDVRWFLANDISAAAYRYGNDPKFKQENIRRICVITVSSGIGNKAFDVVTKELLMDHDGLSGELGHVRIDSSAEAPVCDCGGKGHLMAFASGRAALREIRAAARQNPELYRQSLLYHYSKGNPDAIENSHFAKAAREQDPLALQVLSKVTQPLAQAILVLAASAGIERFVIVGGFALNFGAPYIESLRENMVQLGMFGADDAVVRSLVKLGVPDDDSGLIGIGLLAQREGEEAGVRSIQDVDQNEGFRVSATKEIQYDVLHTENLFDPQNATLERMVTEVGNKRKVLVCLDPFLYANEERRAQIQKYFEARGIEHQLIQVPTDEENKTMENVFGVIEKAKKFGFGRRDIFLAVGSGVMMDVVGLAAQLYRRGVPYIRVPTTLLGMVDAGIGIKTGVNIFGSKNFVGTFYPPKACLNDPSFLASLPDRALRNGLAEILKIAIVLDPQLFGLLEKKQKELREKKFQGMPEAKEVMDLAIGRMLEELQPNLEETNLKRIVDFGHAFGPILEMESHHELLHGEAVAVDMAITSVLANRMGLLPEKDLNRIVDLILEIGLPVYHSSCDPQMLWRKMEEVVKHRGGNLNLPVPLEIGKAIFLDDYREEDLHFAIRYLKMRQENHQFKNNSVMALTADRQLRLETRPIPECGDDEMVVRVQFASVCGTDLQLMKGERPEHPGVLGHEGSVQVVRVGRNVQGFEPGDRVVVNPNNPEDENECVGKTEEGLLQRYLRVPAEWIRRGQVVKLPENILPLQATLIEPFTTVIHCQEKIRQQLRGKTVVIVGAGPIGMMHAMLARVYGAKKVFLANRSKQRLQLAVKNGIVVQEEALLMEEVEERLSQETEGRGADVVIFTISYENAMATLDQMVNLTADGGVITLHGGFAKGDIYAPDVETRVDLWEVKRNPVPVWFQIKGKRILWAGSRGATRHDFDEAIRVMTAGELDLSRLITHVVSFSKLKGVMEQLAADGLVKGIRPGRVVVDTSLEEDKMLLTGTPEFDRFLASIGEKKPAPEGPEERAALLKTKKASSAAFSVKSFQNADRGAQAAACQFVALAQEAICDRGQFTVSLSGGSTPVGLFGYLCREEFYSQIDWSRVHLFWGDERAVGPDHTDSNFRLAQKLIEVTQIPAENVHRVRGESPEPQQEARRYVEELQRVLGKNGRFDLMMLGIGGDAHTLSLFPAEKVDFEKTSFDIYDDKASREVAVIYPKDGKGHRYSLRKEWVLTARRVLVMAYGEAKAEALQHLYDENLDLKRFPSQLLRQHPEPSQIELYTDAPVAAKLPQLREKKETLPFLEQADVAARVRSAAHRMEEKWLKAMGEGIVLLHTAFQNEYKLSELEARQIVADVVESWTHGTIIRSQFLKLMSLRFQQGAISFQTEELIASLKQSIRDNEHSLFRRLFPSQRLKERVGKIDTENALPVGYFGLGRMGGPLSSQMARGGFRVVAFDLNPQAREKLEEVGAVSASSEEEVLTQLSEWRPGGPRLVWIMVSNQKILNRVLFGSDQVPAEGEQSSGGIQRFLQPGDIVVDGGNNDYEQTIRRYRWLQARGVHLVDAGTSGGEGGAREGASFTVGGDPQVLEQLKPHLTQMATIGGIALIPHSGLGHLAKTIHNYMEYGFMKVIGDTLQELNTLFIREYGLSEEESLEQLALVVRGWNQSTLLNSYLLELTEVLLHSKNYFSVIGPFIGGGETGSWGEREAQKRGRRLPLLKSSLDERDQSHHLPLSEWRKPEHFGWRIVAALRDLFGGHGFKLLETGDLLSPGQPRPAEPLNAAEVERLYAASI